MTPAEFNKAVDDAVAARTPWYAKPRTYAVAVGVASLLALICPRVPAPYAAACETLDGVVHTLVPMLGPHGSLSPTTSPATRAAAADELRSITLCPLPLCDFADASTRNAVYFDGMRSCRCSSDDRWRDFFDGGACVECERGARVVPAPGAGNAVSSGGDGG